MCYLMDIDVALDAHVQRTRTNEVRNRIARRSVGHARSGVRRGWQGLVLTSR
ncbi:hypothetical protein [Ornithinimicrobium faecis]|uniref:hypothetical protein n=1 Tax=Ornithinimicrobium faecis TaxID=2934158 RepID=UPI0021192837|nr:hypothetical protein [Ornithinimicrobium sp. HY1745]